MDTESPEKIAYYSAVNTGLNKRGHSDIDGEEESALVDMMLESYCYYEKCVEVIINLREDTDDNRVLISKKSQPTKENLLAGQSLDAEFRLIEKEFIQKVLINSKHDICKAAEFLGIEEDSLKQKIKALKLMSQQNK